MLSSGTTLANFRIVGLIGQGGMGHVYEAHQPSADRNIALKVLSDQYGSDPVLRERFRSEARQLAKLEHPHIVPMIDSGEADGQLWIAMRYVRGGNLKKLVVDRSLDPERTLRILGQIAQALDFAHAAGRIHRDIKPQNILIEGDNAYLADFGLMKIRGAQGLTKSGVLGTPDYMSPEQFQNEATLESDIYALGVVMYECLSGNVPFPRDFDSAVMYAHLNAPVPPLDHERIGVPEAVSGVIGTAMAKDPADRQPSASEFIGQVAAALGSPRANGVRLVPPPAAAEPTILDTRPLETPSPPRAEGTVHDRLDRAEPDTVVSPRQRQRGRKAGAVVVVLFVMTVVAGTGIGLFAGRSPATSSPAKVVRAAASRLLTAGFVHLRYPHAWQRSAAHFEVPGLHLSDAAIVAPRRNASSGGLIVGIASTVPPRYLPSGLSASGYTTIRSGQLEGLRFRHIRATGFNRPLEAYLFPTPVGTAVAMCFGAIGSTRVPSSCESVAGTLRTPGISGSIELPSSSYARGLARILKIFASARHSGRAQLDGAGSSAAQASAARAIAAAYSRAATTIGKLRVTPLERDTNRAISEALARASGAYARLAAAAGAENIGGYRSALPEVGSAEQSVTKVIDRLRSLGYIVS